MQSFLLTITRPAMFRILLILLETVWLFLRKRHQILLILFFLQALNLWLKQQKFFLLKRRFFFLILLQDVHLQIHAKLQISKIF